MSTLRTLSSARPNLRATRPKPPPSVSPPTPVCETVPAVVTSPCAIVSLSMSPSRLPPATRALRALRSTLTLRMSDRSMIMPRSQVDLPDGLWPPHFTATSRLEERAKSTACFTSAAPRGWTIRAGCLSICALMTRRASSYAGWPASSRLPRRLSPSSCTAARARVTPLPSPVIASRSLSTFIEGLKTAETALPAGKVAATAAASEPRTKPRRVSMSPPSDCVWARIVRTGRARNYGK